MNFSAFGARTGSPALDSRAGSPVRRPAEDAIGPPKNDKATRRYATTIEKTLTTWENAPEEWADYIAFLSRLLKALQSAPPGATSLPHSGGIASKLAQCLNPSLPSGVHQKALDIYAYIFATFDKDDAASQLHDYLPGLLPLLSFASLSVRPSLYDILEEHIVRLPPAQLRPVLKSFILSILPALEDETSEDFDRALTTITRLEHTFLREQHLGDYASFYWQSVFLAVITSSSRRQGALNYLVRRLPKFVQNDEHDFTPEAEVAISPEPGLFVRAFACGLMDSQVLIQRGFLDILTTHLPLNSPLLQRRIDDKDFQLLLSATMGVLLRRDMSLNRRIWQWFLGPEAKEDVTEHATTTKQLQYISNYGTARIETSLLTAFATDAARPSERVKPFRIGLSLMDRWEIGDSLVPRIFLPAMTCAYRYSNRSTPAEMSEFLKSANLFFDGVESKLIWSKLHLLLASGNAGDNLEQRIKMLLWILNTFNVREEEMTTIHAPVLALYALSCLVMEASHPEDSSISQWCTLICSLINITSGRAFTAAQGETSTELLNHGDTQQVIAAFYKDTDGKTTRPFEQRVLADLLIRYALDALHAAIRSRSSTSASNIVSVCIQLLSKVPNISDGSVGDLLSYAEEYTALAVGHVASFEILTAVTSLMNAVAALPQGDTASTRDSFVRLEASITPVLLTNISPDKPKYNVEATRLLWRVDSWLEDEGAVQASIQGLVTDSHSNTRKDSMRIFLNLWNLSVSSQSGAAKSPMPGISRRVSNTMAIPEHDRPLTRTHMLSVPLLAALDTLRDPSDAAFDDVDIWLNSSIHTEAALVVLFERLKGALDVEQQQRSPQGTKRVSRRSQDDERALLYVLRHFDNILHHAKPTFWAVLVSTQLSTHRPDIKHSALTILTEQCLKLLAGEGKYSSQAQSLAVSIIDRLLRAPQFVQAAIRVPELGTTIARRLLANVMSGDQSMQCSLLDVTAKALLWQQSASTFAPVPARAATHTRKMSLVAAPSGPVEEPSGTPLMPVKLLVQLLKVGFSSSCCSPYLDSWLHFAEEVLPMIGASLTSVLIPLTETVCTQVDRVFERTTLTAAGQAHTDLHAPEATIAKLLDSLEILLRGAHEVLLHENEDTDNAPPESNGTVLSNMTPNLFKSQGPPSKTAKANSRLTAILACKDVVRVCIRIWLWASSSAEGTEVDRHSAATTSYYAIRLRNRARHMLEEMFNLEPLESLEVVVVHWVSAESEQQKDTVISLLHVLRDLRPKNTVPAILDALCSRTNPALLVPARQSTLTSALTAGDVVLFYSAYLGSLEDDALEEVWSDCTAFLRDVLSNPLPHRQVLPALIWIVYQLAQKLENTNYGERKRMRRELGDNFQRLLAATFAALPSGSIEAASTAREQETPFSAGLKEMNLVVILRDVIGRAETILETSDRVATCINAVSTNLITPTLRSKTFPSKIDADILSLTLHVAKKSPGAKTWRKDVADAFNDPRFVNTSPSLTEKSWFPILQQWALTDKERMNEIVGRLYAPSGAGIMFGVGASAARLDADRKAQFNLRRISALLMASSTDSHVEHLRTIQEKVVELFDASFTSLPSSAIKAELFMLLRALLLSVSPVYFAPLWPIVNDNLQAALLSINADEGQATAQNNLSLLQACKLLDLLAAMSPDEFQLFEWLYLTNTTDAVYHPPDWHPTALSDRLGVNENGLLVEDDAEKEHTYVAATSTSGLRMPMLVNGAGYDTEDVKAMAQDVFVNTALRPFLSQLSINLYESRYRMDNVDLAGFRRNLIEDLQDPGTIVT